MASAMRYKVVIIAVFTIGTMSIVGLLGLFVFGAPLCNGSAMRPSDVCVIQEDGQAAEYSYEERSGEQADQATFFALMGLGALTAVCVYLYPRRGTSSQPLAAPTPSAADTTNTK